MIKSLVQVYCIHNSEAITRVLDVIKRDTPVPRHPEGCCVLFTLLVGGLLAVDPVSHSPGDLQVTQTEAANDFIQVLNLFNGLRREVTGECEYTSPRRRLNGPSWPLMGPQSRIIHLIQQDDFKVPVWQSDLRPWENFDLVHHPSHS